MWMFDKIRESVESVPLDLSRYLGKSEEDICLSSKASLSHHLHNNILTPDKIPEFCLPPRLHKRSPLLEAETALPHRHGHYQSSTSSNTTHVKTTDMKTKTEDASMAWKATKKPLPFSAEGYGLAGIYESPNTRRKESLFHSKCPVYMFDRSLPTAAPRLAEVTHLPKKTLSGFFPLFSSKSLSETGSTGSETPSSSDSSPLSSPYSAKSSLYFPPGSSRLKGAMSCPSLNDRRVDGERRKRGWLSLTNSSSSPPSLKGSSVTLAPPVLSPLDVLHCQEILQHEHVLPLQGRGKVRLFAEHSTVSTSTFPSLSTVRVLVVSVEGLWDTDRRTLNCAVNLCLTPGKLQQQESAIIRNCRSPVFNEDFFFTELTREDLLTLQLWLKVMYKPATGTLRRGTVIGVTTKPLSQLLSLKKMG
ncbi:C2 calcium-dependent domain-containing protein 4C [Clinocottus analis]|uniref:C2 calcium-dependent domain-containing protein 4C n=1 Tax=Clinocottus analis TaxID=304258 RepID=UPI0035C1C8EB